MIECTGHVFIIGGGAITKKEGVSSKSVCRMSILLGPYDKSGVSEKEEEDEDLLIFGYACKLYRDDVKAVMEGSGQLLIPWMGDSSLMVDRFVI